MSVLGNAACQKNWKRNDAAGIESNENKVRPRLRNNADGSCEENHQGRVVAYPTADIEMAQTEFHDEQYAESAQPRMDTIQKSIAENELRIAALVEQRDSATDSSYLESYNSRIAELTEENVDLRLQIEDIQASLDWINSDSRDADIADFTSRLNACRNLLASVTSTYKAVYSNYFDSISGVVYTTNKLTAQGGINVLAAAIAGAVVGAILAGIGICIKDLPSYMRQRRDDAASENDQDVSAEQ